MYISANLTNIPLETLQIARTCWNGVLLNFTQYFDFEYIENVHESTLSYALTEAWRDKFPTNTDFYNKYALPCLRACSKRSSIEGQGAFCLSIGSSSGNTSCLYSEEFPNNPRANCNLFRISGNPDIAGIGLFAAYITMVSIFTFLVTAQAFILLASCVSKNPRCHSASSATFLSFSLLIAGISNTSQNDNYYENVFALAVSTIAIIPLVTLTAVIGPRVPAGGDFDRDAVVEGLSLASTLWGQALSWVTIYTIVKLRRYSSMYRSYDNTENELGYGQIVSMFIWVPVGVDFLYTVFYGSKEGLEGKIPTPFTVEELSSDPISPPNEVSLHGLQTSSSSTT
ncbi:hypothetical protein CPB86DRAFT_794756 [Serendipita vermifera]|nr:hypothetical protein CPB86DRAFT_794756 [Serendipita vermifera]